MEPPAVTSCSQQHSLSSNSNASVEKVRRSMGGGTVMQPTQYHLQIDPNITFNTSVNRPFEELPENFLESISPQQSQQPVQQESPHLAPLAPMSLSSNDSAYATLAPMSAPPSYGGVMKIEPLHEQIHHRGTSIRHQNHPNPLEKLSFGSGPAGLLSPLHTNRNESSMDSTLLGIHQNGGRTSDMLSSLRRPLHYIKEEADLSQEFKPVDTSFLSHHQAQQAVGILSQEQQQQELDHRLANAETPPAVSNVELASSFIATMIGEQPPDSPITQQTLYQQSQRGYRHAIDNTELSGSDDLDTTGAGPSEEQNSGIGIDDIADSPTTARIDNTAGVRRQTYSTKDTNDPLNAEIDDDIYIDTKDLCKRIAWELKQHSIPQAIFAERILCRSQGTLSDLLRNPKPWNKLKSGRETFRRMFNWVQQPLELRLGILDMYKGGIDDAYSGQNGHGGKQLGLPSSSTIPPVLSPPTPAQNARQGSRHKGGHDSENGGHGANGGTTKRPRLVFTDIQKRTLQAIFKETQRPSREMQQTIAEHLRLDLSTVANFFMNARRRSRSGPLMGDVPAPYQQVRPITPPPDSPPQRGQSRTRGSRHGTRSDNETNLAVATSSHIENTVAQVAEEAAEYARTHEQAVENGENGGGSPDLDCETGDTGEPEYKMMRLTSDCDPVMSSTRQSIGRCGIESSSDIGLNDEITTPSPIAIVSHQASVNRRTDSIYVVTVPATIQSDSDLSFTGQHQRSLPVMSFGNKIVTVKVERESNNTAATAANSE